MSDVTVVLTSCGRYDLLRETLKSFHRYNTYALHQFIVIEDGEPGPEFVALAKEYPGITWLATGTRCGQIACVDEAYSRVTTPYIFHCEDDWQFYRPGFIEASREILQHYANVLQVWLRAGDDTNGHPFGPMGGGIPYPHPGHDIPAIHVMEYGYNGIWHGFSFNPGLRRLADYQRIAPFGAFAPFNPQAPWQSEADIGRVYQRLGMWAAILPEGYVKHIGDGRGIRS